MCGSLIVNCFKLIRFKLKRCYLIIAVFIFLLYISCAPSQNCPQQISRVSSNAFQTVYWRSKSIRNEIVTSDPPCSDEEGNLIRRTCHDGLWIPEQPPICETVIETNISCPVFFKETNSCVYVSELQPWGTRCKILNENVTNRKYPLPLKGDFVWLPFKREIKYGPYEWVSMGERYGKPIGDWYNFSNTEDVFNKNCIVSNIRNDSMKPEYCGNSYIHVCPFYDYEFHICPDNCVSAGIGTSNCNCKIKDKSCEDYIEINTPFDKNILSALANKDECYVGATNTHIPLLQGYKQAVNKTSWFYTKKSLNCSICSVRSIEQIPNVEMILTFEKTYKKLHLQIYSPEGLYKRGHDKYVYCFTDASKELKKRVDVEMKYEHIMTDNKERSFNIYEVELEDYIGYYWCEAHRRSLSDKLVYSNKVLAYKRKKGNEYSFRIVVNDVCRYFSCKYVNNILTISYDELTDNIYDSIFDNLDAELRVMEIFYLDYLKLDVLIHISTNNETGVVREYNGIKVELNNIPSNIKIIYFKSSEFCMPEVTEIDNKKLSWPLTYIDNSVAPDEMCLQNNLPIFRVCKGSFLYGADWSTVKGKCQSDTYIHESTQYLYTASKENISKPLIENVTQVIDKYTDLSVLAIYYLNIFFKSIYHTTLNNAIVDNTIDLTDSLLKVNPINLADAQNLLNSTDDILDIIEDILTNFKIDSQVYLIQKKRIVVHITNPYLSNVSGIILYSSDNEIIVEDFKRNNTFDDILENPDVLLAAYVPEVILQDIYDQNLTDIHIVTTVFFNNHLFVSNSKKPTGPIISITIPGYGNYLPSSLPILFKTSENETSPECGFWDYGKNTERKKGQWSTIGGNYLGNNDENIHSCTFSHLTHFALLILDENVSLQFVNNTDYYFLTVITFIGGVLTVVGVTGIFLTAVLFEKWRKKRGTKILINLSIVILLEALTMYLSELKGFINSELSCQIVGSVIHYIVLSKFLWMLVYAFLQYMRFVKVLGDVPENIVLKSAVFGWGIAIIPVVIVNVVTPYTYTLGDYRFCYPKGLSLYLGVVMPVVLIILINLVVFVVVMYQISSTRIESHCGSTESYTLQLKLATLLFFVLGIPWIFGVLANLITVIWLRTVLVYLFCITSTVQGFILFLFYVLFNKETRTYWTSYCLNRETLVIVTSSKTT